MDYKLNLNKEEEEILISLIRAGKLALLSNITKKMPENIIQDKWREVAEMDITLQSVVEKVEKTLHKDFQNA